MHTIIKIFDRIQIGISSTFIKNLLFNFPQITNHLPGGYTIISCTLKIHDILMLFISSQFPTFLPTVHKHTHKMKFLKPAPSGGLLATKTEDIPLESHTPHMVVSIYSSFLLSPSQGWDSNCKHVVPQLSYRTIYALGRY